MGFLGVVLIVVFIITSVLLIGVVLIQDEQGEGLGGIFGGGSSTPFGSRSGNVLTRFTSILGAIFLFCSFGMAWVNRSQQQGNVVAAAQRQESSTTTEWWNSAVNSNEKLPAAQKGASTGIAPASSQTAPQPQAASPTPATATAAGSTSQGASAAPSASGSGQPKNGG
ncbi:MAG TPA: preprotein translocase subunit SecG [Spirochaetia bacterium]|nr:preprotein translocase subunit SecG [Spirochaetia bacterium]